MSVSNNVTQQHIAQVRTSAGLYFHIVSFLIGVKSFAVGTAKRAWRSAMYDEPVITCHGQDTALNLLIGGKGF